jgi:hypothetical protein
VRKSNERKGERGGGRAWGRGRAPGAHESERAGLGRVAGIKPTTRTATDREPNRETRLSKTRD